MAKRWKPGDKIKCFTFVENLPNFTKRFRCECGVLVVVNNLNHLKKTCSHKERVYGKDFGDFHISKSPVRVVYTHNFLSTVQGRCRACGHSIFLAASLWEKNPPCQRCLAQKRPQLACEETKTRIPVKLILANYQLNFTRQWLSQMILRGDLNCVTEKGKKYAVKDAKWRRWLARQTK